MKPRIIIGLLALVLPLAGCGGSDDGSAPPGGDSPAVEYVEAEIQNTVTAMEARAADHEGFYSTPEAGIHRLTADDNFLEDYGLELDDDVSISVSVADDGTQYYIYASHAAFDWTWRYDSHTEEIEVLTHALPEPS